MSRDVKKLITEMTLEEKASLCSGKNFWETKNIDRLGIPSIMLTDGPHGLRKQEGDTDHLGLNKSVPATCFPAGAALACSWDRELLQEVGQALGEESQAEGVAVILGPAANIKRSPLCGRNFEYFSEDPYLSSEMATAHIKGVQSQGVGTSIKHYAANNQEYKRMTVDAIVDERTLREIYLASFEGAVKQGQPWTVMCAYNQLNGSFCSENRRLLHDILKEEWGYEGIVVSDWGAVNKRAPGLAAGLELEMPYSNGVGEQKIIQAVREGKLEESVLDAAVERMLKLIFTAVDNKKADAAYSKEKHHELARQVARECMVLLQNNDNLLPLKKTENIAVLGAFARKPRYQGGGSSHITPSQLDDIFVELKKCAGDSASLAYAEGYQLDSEEADEKLLREAKELAAKSGVAIVFAGLPDAYESEGYDREHMRMPASHNALIEAVAEVQENVIVVLSNGSPVEMPWLNKVKSVLEVYLGGQALGGAIADILFGEVNPCGKLAETFPIDLRHNPSYINFPGEVDKVEYREGIFVGYRYYDKTNTRVLFPFGHGLSYTNFAYTGMEVDKKEMTDQDTVKVTVQVKNTGQVAGKEIVQLYVRDVASSVIRPEKELRGFAKVDLEPGEEKQITFELGKRAFAYYNTKISDWYVESGEFEILVGRSSADIQLEESIEVSSTAFIWKKFHRNSYMSEIMADPRGAEIIKQMGFGGQEQISEDSEQSAMIEAMMKYLPMRALVNFSMGKFTEEALEMLLEHLNGE